jgi:glycosyltransferase involved in cell wall biosynthesis
MKILWVNQYFLHPTERGGQIRSLGILRPLHARHEVHYAALDDPSSPVGMDMAPTFCSRAYPIPHRVVSRRSPAIGLQVAQHLAFSDLPLAVSRYASAALREKVRELTARVRFDAVVCDFAASGVNMPTLHDAVLFQHNVETTIFERHATNGATAAHRWFYGVQAARMHRYEERICRESAHVIAVSPVDAERMRTMFGISHVSDVPTGVDVEALRCTVPRAPQTDLVFVGSMDWLPNIDGMLWFASEILPLIRRQRPECGVTIVGRRPDPRLVALSVADPLVKVTGTVDDVRPYLWDARVAILPLRVGGGTRMKVYESMAAGVPMVSTSVGMEGLACVPGRDIVVADSAEDFAAECLRLLDTPNAAARIAESAYDLVSRECSHEAVAQVFESVLLRVADQRRGAAKATAPSA